MGRVDLEGTSAGMISGAETIRLVVVDRLIFTVVLQFVHGSRSDSVIILRLIFGDISSSA
jgi:hypothetical protein